MSANISVEILDSTSRREDVTEALNALYGELDREIGALGPACWNKGECCHFGEFGHRLYVTTLEVAYYLAMESEESESLAADRESAGGLPILQTYRNDSAQRAATSDTCPHAWGGRCHVRERRPLGCRIFYCDPAAQSWQGAMTERYLARLRALHEELNVPYVYADWMAFLKALGRV